MSVRKAGEKEERRRRGEEEENEEKLMPNEIESLKARSVGPECATITRRANQIKPKQGLAALEQFLGRCHRSHLLETPNHSAELSMLASYEVDLIQGPRAPPCQG